MTSLHKPSSKSKIPNAIQTLVPMLERQFHRHPQGGERFPEAIYRMIDQNHAKERENKWKANNFKTQMQPTNSKGLVHNSSGEMRIWTFFKMQF